MGGATCDSRWNRLEFYSTRHVAASAMYVYCEPGYSVPSYCTVDQSSELAEALKRSQLELVEARTDCSKLTCRLEEVAAVSEAVGSLREELVCKDETITELRRECELCERVCCVSVCVV